MWEHYRQVSSQKQNILVVLVLKEYLEGQQQQEHFIYFVLKLISGLT